MLVPRCLSLDLVGRPPLGEGPIEEVPSEDVATAEADAAVLPGVGVTAAVRLAVGPGVAGGVPPVPLLAVPREEAVGPLDVAGLDVCLTAVHTREDVVRAPSGVPHVPARGAVRAALRGVPYLGVAPPSIPLRAPTVEEGVPTRVPSLRGVIPALRGPPSDGGGATPTDARRRPPGEAPSPFTEGEESAMESSAVAIRDTEAPLRGLVRVVAVEAGADRVPDADGTVPSLAPEVGPLTGRDDTATREEGAGTAAEGVRLPAVAMASETLPLAFADWYWASLALLLGPL